MQICITKIPIEFTRVFTCRAAPLLHIDALLPRAKKIFFLVLSKNIYCKYASSGLYSLPGALKNSPFQGEISMKRITISISDNIENKLKTRAENKSKSLSEYAGFLLQLGLEVELSNEENNANKPSPFDEIKALLANIQSCLKQSDRIAKEHLESSLESQLLSRFLVKQFCVQNSASEGPKAESVLDFAKSKASEKVSNLSKVSR